MKTTIVIALLSLSAFSGYAQSNDYKACRKSPDMPANAVMVFPKSEYTNTEDASCPPCYEYTTKHGLKVMECPFAMFPPENNGNTATTSVTTTQNDAVMDVQSQNSYTGNYPEGSCPRFADAPANAVPVWPKSAYTPLANASCAPCYEYTTKRGLKVMECPYAQFK